MFLFQIVKVLAVGIKRLNSTSAITSALSMIGFGDVQTGILVMMLLSLITYIISMEVIKKKDDNLN